MLTADPHLQPEPAGGLHPVISELSFASVQSSYLDRVQTLFGKPGTIGSLNSAFNELETSLTSLSASPDSFATRALGPEKAQVLASTLNRLTTDIRSSSGRSREQNRDERRGHQRPARVDGEDQQPSRRSGHRSRLASDAAGPARSADFIALRADGSARQLPQRRHRGVDDALQHREILDGRASVFSFESAGALNACPRSSTPMTASRVSARSRC